MKRNLLKPLIRLMTGITFLKPVILLTRTAYYSLIDIYESLFRPREDMVPPRRMTFMGYGDYKRTGREFLKYFVEMGGLKPTDNILDVGCGIGRMAAPITGYLSDDGHYEGIDILAKGINWCNKNITPRHPNFQFRLAGIYNKQYNPKGKYQPSTYKFPFQDDSFDFIFLTSVFTHMLAGGIENYLSEISRVLKKDGTCFITFFLLNEQSLNLIDKKNSAFDFRYPGENCRFKDKAVPERAIAFDEGFIRNLYKRYALQILEPVKYGSWCGRKDFLSFQDVIVARKIDS